MGEVTPGSLREDLRNRRMGHSNHAWRRSAACALALCFWAPAREAAASGLGIPDLGAEGLAQGGAQVAAPGNLTALWYNPAGLMGIEESSVQMDPRVVWHRVGFQRLGSDGRNPQGFAAVHNTGAPTLSSMAPIGGLAARWSGGPLPMVFAIGGFPLNGATGYNYPDPDALRRAGASTNQTNQTNQEIAQQAPQRYASISSASKVYIAALAVAARVLPWLDAGAEFQLANASFSSRQSVASGLVAGEDPELDAQLSLDGSDFGRPSGAFGLSAQLPGGLHLGLSYQLPYRFHANGTLTADIPPTLVAAGASIDGQAARFHVTLPWYWRFGVRLRRPLFEVELAGTLDGWSSYSQIRVVPLGISFKLGGTTQVLPEIVLRKDLQDAISLRLGGAFHAGELWPAVRGLTLLAGALYETSAVPEERQSLDLMHWARGSLNAGASFAAGRWTFAAGYSHFVQPDRQVRSSTVQQVLALPGNIPTVVGNGDYSSQLDQVSISAAVRFGGDRTP